MNYILIAIQYLCILVMFVEGCLVFRNCRTKVHVYLFFSIVVNLINSLGYLFELKAHSGEAYMTALKISYFGRTWVAFSVFLFVMELCKVNVPVLLKIFLALLHGATFIVVLTTPEHDLFYKDISFITVDGFIRMQRSSGIWHILQSISVALYMIVILAVLFITLHREHNKTTKKRLLTVLIAMLTEAVFTSVQIFIQTPITYIYDLTMPGFTLGTVIMLVAIFRFDLLAAEQLAKEYISDKLSEGIVAVDNDGKVQYFNEPAKKLYPELVGTGADVPSEITEAVEKGGTITINGRIYKPQENELTHSGERVGVLYALVDETDYYQYMEELENQKRLADSANKSKSMFLSNMSHEIRTPINAVLGMDEMILRECDDENIVSYASDIRTAGRTLLSLINDILDFSKIEEGKMEIIPAQYELSSMINDLVNMIRGRAENKGLELKVNVNEKIPHLLFGDEIRIKQCALNILTNAVKYTEKGSVSFSVDYEEKDSSEGPEIILKIAVKDTGIGMKREDIDKLFSPFTRIEEKRNRSIEGTGLGMSITEQLLALMGSKLDVTSVYGEGSEFRFDVVQKVVKNEPIGDYSSRYREENKNASYRESFHAPDAKILVVDDTPVNLSVIKGLLKKTKIRVDTALSGKDAVELAKQNRYDMAFIDHMMPDMDGIETLEKIHGLSGCDDLFCVALTANAVSGAREMYIKAGFSDYLSKPVDGETLEKMIMQNLPKEKVQTVSDDEESRSENAPELPEKLFDIREINVDSGLKHCGTPDVYLETLAVYESTALSNADEIFGFWTAGNIADATIKIHALKSTSRAIGADELGALAEKLEMAGKANDKETLGAHIDELVMRYRSLGTQLSELFGNDEEDDGKPPIPDGLLEKTYKTIVEFSENFDIDGAALAIESISKYSIPDSEKERYMKIKKAADEFDWDAVQEIAGGK